MDEVRPGPSLAEMEAPTLDKAQGWGSLCMARSGKDRLMREVLLGQP
jgi:hypothetical protein